MRAPIYWIELTLLKSLNYLYCTQQQVSQGSSIKKFKHIDKHALSLRFCPNSDLIGKKIANYKKLVWQTNLRIIIFAVVDVVIIVVVAIKSKNFNHH